MKSKITKEQFFKNAAVIVAHPDDETLRGMVRAKSFWQDPLYECYWLEKKI